MFQLRQIKVLTLCGMLVAVAAAWEDRQESLCAAAVLGLLCALLFSPVVPCFYVLTFAAAAFLTGLISKHLIVPGFFCALVASAAAVALSGLLHALFLTFRGVADPAAAASILGRELVLTLPLVPLVYLLYRPIHRRFAAD